MPPAPASATCARPRRPASRHGVPAVLEEGDLNRYVNVYLNDEDVRVLDGLDTGVSDSDTIVILPAMAGGGPLDPAGDRRGRGRDRRELGPIRARGLRLILRHGHPFPVCDPRRFEELLADDGVMTAVAEAEGVLLGHSTFGGSRDPDVGPEVGEVAQLLRRPRRALAPRGGQGADAARARATARPRATPSPACGRCAANDRANAFYAAHGFTRDGAEREEEVWADIPPRFGCGDRCRRLARVRVENLQRVEPFITLDGSEIREVAGPPTGNAERIRAWRRRPSRPGGETIERFHRVSEEIYFFTHGNGHLRLGDEERGGRGRAPTPS